MRTKRWKQLEKCDWRRYKYPPKEDSRCPVCGDELGYHYDHDERGCVEREEYCESCGYADRWYYGIQEFYINWEMVDEFCPHMITNHQFIKRHKRFEKLIKQERKRRKAYRMRLFHKKKVRV